MNTRVIDINPEVLRQCREQVGLSHADVGKKIKLIVDIEEGKQHPTFKQLDTLSELYNVPRWVFLRENLPDEYNFSQHMPAFRQFANSSPAFSQYKVRYITASVERFREFILDLRIDMEEEIEPFSPPTVTEQVPQLARLVKEWLGLTDLAYPFDKWKKACEDKEIFVFLTSNYNSWSKVDLSVFRGFSIYKEQLPIIVINGSDAQAAQSFTLLHELGHLLHKESAIDETTDSIQNEHGSEAWCNEFAREMLMPRDVFIRKTQEFEITGEVDKDVAHIDAIAKTFKVSSDACAVRMLRLGKINQQQYQVIKEYLNEKYIEIKELRRKANIPMRRNIPKEKLHQYGSIYSSTIVQAYRDQEISLHRLCQIFGFKKTSDAFKLNDLI